eukprot:701479-Rhodomonas_salina.1
MAGTEIGDAATRRLASIINASLGLWGMQWSDPVRTFRGMYVPFRPRIPWNAHPSPPPLSLIHI